MGSCSGGFVIIQGVQFMIMLLTNEMLLRDFDQYNYIFFFYNQVSRTISLMLTVLPSQAVLITSGGIGTAG